MFLSPPPPPPKFSLNICEFICSYKISVHTNSLLTIKWDWTRSMSTPRSCSLQKVQIMCVSAQNNILVYDSQIYLMSFDYLMLVFWFLSFQTFSVKDYSRLGQVITSHILTDFKTRYSPKIFALLFLDNKVIICIIIYYMLYKLC